jgi:hypothetical protein
MSSPGASGMSAAAGMIRDEVKRPKSKAQMPPLTTICVPTAAACLAVAGGSQPFMYEMKRPKARPKHVPARSALRQACARSVM